MWIHADRQKNSRSTKETTADQHLWRQNKPVCSAYTLLIVAAVAVMTTGHISTASLNNCYQQQQQQHRPCRGPGLHVNVSSWLTDRLTDRPTDRLSACDSVSVRRSVAGLSSQRSGFSPTKVHVGFVVEQHELQRFFQDLLGAVLFVCMRHLLKTRMCTQMLTLQWRHCVRWSEWKAVSRCWCQGNFACCFVWVWNLVSQSKWRTLGCGCQRDVHSEGLRGWCCTPDTVWVMRSWR